MSFQNSFFAIALAGAALVFAAPTPAHADKGQRLLDTMVGEWRGDGQLNYTQQWSFPFKCEIEGRTTKAKGQVDLVGKCWSGPIWSRMAAALRYNAKSRSYVGRFRDGTNTFVIDIKGRRSGDTIDLDLRQGRQQGALGLDFDNNDKVDLTIAIVNPETKAQRKVVDLTLNRKTTKVGALN